MRILGALKTAVAAVFLARSALSVAVFHHQNAAVRRDEMLEGSHVRLGARDATLSTQISSALQTGYPNSSISVTATVATSNISSSPNTVITTTSTATSTLTTTATATSGGDTATTSLSGGGGIATSTSGKDLMIEIQNHRDEPINAYIGGKQKIVNGQNVTLEPVMLRIDKNQYYPLRNVPANDTNSPSPVPTDVPLAIRIPAKSSSNVTLPDYLISGRVWIAEGDLEFRAYPGGAFSEPSGANPSLEEYNVKWGFVELNNDVGGIIINLSFVDWVSLSLGMSLTFQTPQGTTNTSTVDGFLPGAMQKICDDLKAQAKISGIDGTHDWDKLCIYSKDGKDLLRVFSPNIDASIQRPNSTLVNYYDDYINQVWDKYQKQNLTLQLQGGSDGLPLTTPGAGQNTTCSVQANSNMTCDQSDHSYPKPTTADIWGCNSGPFVVGDINATIPRDLMHSRIIPRLCAAFTRSTLLLDRGDVQPFFNVTDYYSANVTNHYSRIVHNYLANGKGYAFSFDDVNPMGIDHDAAGVLAADNPTKVHIDVKDDK